jgi:antitoxin (DNA-binding transcriptional repressor) of toxin-antitoxin stability system
MKQVRVYEFKSHLSRLLRVAEGGETIEVLDRARPIARVVPVPGVSGPESELEVTPAERPFAALRRRRMPALKLPLGSLEALRVERGER